jgi:hypothetical protein
MSFASTRTVAMRYSNDMGCNGSRTIKPPNPPRGSLVRALEHINGRILDLAQSAVAQNP